MYIIYVCIYTYICMCICIYVHTHSYMKMIYYSGSHLYRDHLCLAPHIMMIVISRLDGVRDYYQYYQAYVFISLIRMTIIISSIMIIITLNYRKHSSILASLPPVICSYK